ncbi:hypothetical protein G9A89_020007 [Geosiphon pyriformis]|nr:hypothetical protein G9A89_020007 [Geosiphon pyriformis]
MSYLPQGTKFVPDINSIMNLEQLSKEASSKDSTKTLLPSFRNMLLPSTGNVSTKKFCYQHRPNQKNQSTGIEPKKKELQKQLENLSKQDQSNITHIWSLFSAAPAKNRRIILQGLLNECCSSQLSFLSNSLDDLIRIDFLNSLPNELSFHVLSFLDAKSLCRVAQVSKTWKFMADDDVVWHKMCEQHIDKKCTKCGWGLPLLDRKRKGGRKFSPHSSLNGVISPSTGNSSCAIDPCTEDRFSQLHHNISLSSSPSPSYSSSSSPDSSSPNSPGHVSYHEERETKRLCISEKKSVPLFPSLANQNNIVLTKRTRPWKDVYSERLVVERNWRKGRFKCHTLRGHTDYIACLQFDDDSNTLITGSHDATVRVWNIETGEMIRILKGHRRGVRALQFDEAKLITCSLDRTLRIWNYHTGQSIRILEGHTDAVNCLQFDQHILASGSVNAIIKVWNTQTAQCFTLTGHRDTINRVVIYEKNILFSSSDDKTIRIWNLKTRSCISKLEGHVDQIQFIQPASPSLFAGIIKKANESTEDWIDYDREVDHHPGHALPVLVSASLDNTIKIWSTKTNRCLGTLFGHAEGVWTLAFDKLRMVSGSEDKTVKVWDLDTGKCLHTLKGHIGAVYCVALSDTKIITAGEDMEVRIWDFRN